MCKENWGHNAQMKVNTTEVSEILYAWSKYDQYSHNKEWSDVLEPWSTTEAWLKVVISLLGILKLIS